MQSSSVRGLAEPVPAQALATGLSGTITYPSFDPGLYVGSSEEPASENMAKHVLPDVAAIEAAGAGSGANTSDTRRVAPIVWLIGKVQSGKTSIVRAITQSSAAEIGTGYKACTRTAKVFDFPAEYPILRFLDTRGLGESNYDPSEDLTVAESQAHLMLVTMRAMDLAQDAILDVVQTVRRKHPSWPIVVAQTSLHEGYAAGQGHTLPYPFSAEAPERGETPALPRDLLRCLKHQQSFFADLPGAAPVAFVPVDFTLASDDMMPSDYGLEALAEALVSVAPAAMRAALQLLPVAVRDARTRSADPLIMGHAMAAGGTDLVPVAGVVAVSAIQARLLQRIGQIFDVTWDRRTLAEFAAALGAGVAVRTLVGIGARQLAKLIPVYGQTIGAATSAAMSYAVTFAMGKAAVHFLTQRQRGLATDGTAKAYQEALRHALRLATEAKIQPGKDKHSHDRVPQ